jgi:hypothetical protein
LAIVAIAMCMTAARAEAQVTLRSDRAVYFTFSQSVALPQVTLPAGRYLFRLADSQTNRSVVQIYSADGQRLHGMMMTMPTERPTASDNAEIRFMETPAGTPPPVRSYWYPGMTRGWEFIYPREQAMTIARASNTPVLTTAENVSGDAMQSAEVVRVDPGGRNVAAGASSGEPSGVASRGEVASDVPAPATTVARAEQAPQAPPAQAAQGGPARSALPQTASPAPTVLLAALLAVIAALGLGVYRRMA